MHTQTYLHFHNFNSLNRHHKLMEKLIDSYKAVFADPDLWNEHYSSEQVLANLQHGLSGKAGIRLCLQNHQLMAFCWAQLLPAAAIEKAVLNIEYVKNHGHADIRQLLQQYIGDQSVIYLHDLGISQQHRGRVSLSRLICPLLQELSARSGIRRIFFWSIADSRIFRLAERAGFQLCGEVDGLQFFCGDLDNHKLHKLAAFRHAGTH